MKHGYVHFGKVPVPGTFWVRVHLDTYSIYFFLKKKLGTAECSSGTAECGWIWLEYGFILKLCHLANFFFFSFFGIQTKAENPTPTIFLPFPNRKTHSPHPTPTSNFHPTIATTTGEAQRRWQSSSQQRRSSSQ